MPPWLMLPAPDELRPKSLNKTVRQDSFAGCIAFTGCPARPVSRVVPSEWYVTSYVPLTTRITDKLA